MRLFYSILFLISLLYLGACESEAERLERLKQALLYEQIDTTIYDFDQYLQRELYREGLPGLAYCVVYRGKVVAMNTYGLCSVNGPDSINIQSLFRLASVSKGFASTLTGAIIQKKALSWEDSIYQYLPDFKLKTLESTQSLQVKHVLSHTSGLAKHTCNHYIEKDATYKSIQGHFKDAHILAKHGERYAYQNAIYNLSADLLERTTGSSYENLLKQYFLDPLQMKHTTVNYKGIAEADNVARPHVKVNGKWTVQKIDPDWYKVPAAAGINTSIEDMAQWLKALLGEYPLLMDSSLLQTVFDPVIDLPEKDPNRARFTPGLKSAQYAKGFRVIDFLDYHIIYHGGYLNGYRPELALVPDRRLGLVVLVNAAPSQLSDKAVANFFRIYQGHEPNLDSLLQVETH